MTEILQTQAPHHGEADIPPFISVVIPVRNEAGHISAILSDLAAQDYPVDRYEIIVADGESTDGTEHIVHAFRQCVPSMEVAIVPNAARLASAGRNSGVLHSRGELIVFVDGHCRVPDTGFLSATAEIFNRTGAECLCRPQPLETPGRGVFQRAVAAARASAFGHGRDSTIYTRSFEGECDPTSSGASYRRSVLSRLGGYDESFDACEDVEFNHRVKVAGCRSYFSPRLTVLYEPRTTIGGLWRQMNRYGRGRFRFFRKHPRGSSMTQFLPALFLLGLTAGLILSAFSQVARIGLLLASMVWLFFAVSFSVQISRRFGWINMVLLPPIYATIHAGLGAGFCLEMLSALLGYPSRLATAARRSSFGNQGEQGKP